MPDPFKSKMSDEQFGKHQFKVALSFPSKHRTFARKVANCLAKELGHESIFFDEWYSVQLIGKNGDIKLHEIYNQRSNYVVPFFSEHYSSSWCKLEWDSIRGMLVERKKDNSVIAIRMDDSAIPGWNFTDFDVRREKLTTAQVGKIILHKIVLNTPVNSIVAIQSIVALEIVIDGVLRQFDSVQFLEAVSQIPGVSASQVQIKEIKPGSIRVLLEANQQILNQIKDFLTSQKMPPNYFTDKNIVVHAIRWSTADGEQHEFEFKKSVSQLTEEQIHHPKEFNYHAFLSHHSDDKSIVGIFNEKLMTMGFSTFLDQNNLLAGQDYNSAIEAAIEQSHCMIVFLGKNGPGSTQHIEITKAIQEEPDKKMIPVLLPGASKKLPFQLTGKHYVELHDNKYDLCVDSIITSITSEGFKAVNNAQCETDNDRIMNDSTDESFDQTLRSKVKSLISEKLAELSQVELDELSTLLNPSLSVPESAETDESGEGFETDLSDAIKLASKLVKSVFPESYFLQFLIQTYCQLRDAHHKQDKLESAMKEMINWLFPLQLPTEILQKALQQFNSTGAVLITELIERPGTAEILISALGGSKLNTRDKPVRKISFENPPLDKPTKEDKELLVFQEITKKLDPGVPLVNLADKKSCMAQIKGVLRLDLNDPSRSTKFILIDLPKSDPSRKSSTNSQSRVKQYEDVLREISENLGGLLFVELTPQENEAFIAEEAFIAQCLNMLVIT